MLKSALGALCSPVGNAAGVLLSWGDTPVCRDCQSRSRKARSASVGW